jgi:hypothetical protein
MQNKNNIGKVMLLHTMARPRYDEGGVDTFDVKVVTWAFDKETPSLKKEY